MCLSALPLLDDSQNIMLGFSFPCVGAHRWRGRACRTWRFDRFSGLAAAVPALGRRLSLKQVVRRTIDLSRSPRFAQADVGRMGVFDYRLPFPLLHTA